MKLITYEVTWQTETDVIRELVEVKAKNINTGVAKAIPIALRGVPKGHEFVKIEFAEAKW